MIDADGLCSQFDLDLSVEKGLWATQKHNEGVLDQAFRTSKEVYLIFGVNKSGEFYGHARYVYLAYRDIISLTCGVQDGRRHSWRESRPRFVGFA